MSDLFEAKEGVKTRELAKINFQDVGEDVEISVKIVCPKSRFPSSREFHRRIQALGEGIKYFFGPEEERSSQ